MCKTAPGLARLALLGLGLLLITSACRPTEVRYPETGASLEGTITYNKEKVPGALVIAVSATSSAQTFADDNGHYQLTNVPLGEVNIGVNTDPAKAKASAPGGSKAKLVEVPKSFQDPAKSGIKTTVKEGANTYDIVITR
jgi:hypothetical protein